MKTKEKIKLMLVDDHLVVRMGIASILSFDPDFEVVGQADSGAEALSMVQTLKPDVVIMDLMMPDMDGVEATRQIHAVRPDVRILVLTSFGTSVEVHHAIEAGATGALVKTSTQDEICSAVRQVFNGSASSALKSKTPSNAPTTTQRYLSSRRRFCCSSQAVIQTRT